VRQVPAAIEAHAQDRVAGAEQRLVDALVGLAAGIGLDVDVLDVEQLLGALDRKRLCNVDELAAAIVALARVALGIFVGHDRALRLEHRLADDVLGRDQLDLVLLAAQLARDGVGDFGVDTRKAGAEVGGEASAHGRSPVGGCDG
jgi:hypothetical protein